MAGNGGLYQNKYEAMLEKKNAERMILDKDYAGARDKLRRAHSLFPIDDIVPMLTVCDVLSASTQCFPAVDIDYYWILRLTPISTISDIKHSHRKLTSLLRPLTHIFPGTELALKLIQDAFTVLSDIDSRKQFDLHRSNVWTNFQLNGFGALVVDTISDMDIEISDEVPFGCPKKTPKIQEVSSGKNQSADTHPVNACTNIVPRELSNQEASPKNSKGKEIESSSCLGGSDHDTLKQDFYNFDDDRIVSNLKPGQIWATHHQSIGPHNFRYAQIVTNDMSTVSTIWLKPIPVGDEERRWCESGLPVACGSFVLDLEIGEQRSSPLIFSHECSCSPGLTIDQFDIYPKKGEVWALYEDWDIEEWPSDPDAYKSCHYMMVEIISDFSKYIGVDCACLTRVQGFNSIFETKKEDGNPIILHISPGMLYKFSHKVPFYRLTGKEKDGVHSGMLELEHSALSDYIITKKQPDQTMSTMEDLEDTISIEDDESSPPQTSYLSENQVLGDNQSLNFAAAGQLWAIYSGRDNMPRQYVIIEDIISKTHAQVTFLEHEPASKSEMNWKKRNLPVSCGFYIVGGTTVKIEMSQLSHPIRCQKTMSGYIIYPMKGEVWAMYQDWNSNWERSNYEACEYSILEVVSDLSDGDRNLSEGDRILVARLAKVVGCLTFYVKSELNGYELTREIPRKDILSFSHQIPCFKVPGIGLYGIPDSSWHLEPNALPPKRRR